MENIGTVNGFCAQTANLWQNVGIFLTMIKIILPVTLIVIGIIALGKAVISDDEKAVKNAVSKLVKKFVVCVCIVFLPTIISTLFFSIDTFAEVKDDYSVCNTCIKHPKSKGCLALVTTN